MKGLELFAGTRSVIPAALCQHIVEICEEGGFH